MTIEWSAFPSAGEIKVGTEVVGLTVNDVNARFNFPGTGIKDADGAYLLRYFPSIGPAMNYVAITSAETGDPAVVAAAGGDVNVGLRLEAQGDGNIFLVTSSGGIVQFSGTSATRLPTGNTAQRPTGNPGYIRYNTDGGLFEYYSTTTSDWQYFITSTNVVMSVTGAADQIIASSPTGNVTLSIANPFIIDSISCTDATVTVGDLTVTAGNLIVSAGDIDASAGSVTAEEVVATTSVTSPAFIAGSATYGTGNRQLGKNLLINSRFQVNQRGYTSGQTINSGVYAHDRWVQTGGSSSNYTYDSGPAVTITGGNASFALGQLIEGSNIFTTGSYTLSWQGTATASLNGLVSGSSPLTATLTAGTQAYVVFFGNGGTVLQPQLEFGSVPTQYEWVDDATEFLRCLRYFCAYPPLSIPCWGDLQLGGYFINWFIPCSVPFRAVPTLSNIATGASYYNGAAVRANAVLTINGNVSGGSTQTSYAMNFNGGGLGALGAGVCGWSANFPSSATPNRQFQISSKVFLNAEL